MLLRGRTLYNMSVVYRIYTQPLALFPIQQLHSCKDSKRLEHQW